MDKPTPLLPFAFIRSASNERLPLSSTPRRHKMLSVPSLKRKMGASFNENDDTKRHVLDWWVQPNATTTTTTTTTHGNSSTASAASTVATDVSNLMQHDDSYSEGHTDSTQDYSDAEIPVSDEPLDNLLPPSSPYRDDVKSELGQSLPEQLSPVSPCPNTTLTSDFDHVDVHASSEADFGIDQFHRFKTGGSSQIPASANDDAKKTVTYELARSKIIQCFEELRTTINLDHMNLYDVPTEINDLNNMVIFQNGPGKPYQLYLSGNNLSDLCPALFEFTKLNILALRRNRLTWIPPCISKLTELTYLSTSSNHIPFYPFQILSLDKLETFQAGPNPLLSPQSFELDRQRENAGEHSRHTLRAVSKIHTLLASRAGSTLPSLKSLCLNVIAHYDVSYQETRSWKKHVHKPLHGAIASAISKGRFGDHCAECSNIVVEPYAEVYEWWDVLLNENIPFRRQFCCGRCSMRYRHRNIQ